MQCGRLPAMQEIQIWPLSKEDPVEKEITTHPSILTWKNPLDRGAEQATVLWVLRVRHNFVTKPPPLLKCWVEKLLNDTYFMLIICMKFYNKPNNIIYFNLFIHIHYYDILSLKSKKVWISGSFLNIFLNHFVLLSELMLEEWIAY